MKWILLQQCSSPMAKFVRRMDKYSMYEIWLPNNCCSIEYIKNDGYQKLLLFSHTIYVMFVIIFWFGLLQKKKKDVSFQMNCIIGESCKMDQLKHWDNSKSNKNELAIQTILVMIMMLLKITDGTKHES